jgi:hypothetical protein
MLRPPQASSCDWGTCHRLYEHTAAMIVYSWKFAANELGPCLRDTYVRVTKAGVSLARAFLGAAGPRSAADHGRARGRCRSPRLRRRAPSGPRPARRRRPPPARQAGARRSTAPALGLARSAFYRRACSVGFATLGMMSGSLAGRACTRLRPFTLYCSICACSCACRFASRCMPWLLSCHTFASPQRARQAHAHASLVMRLSAVWPSTCSPLAVLHHDARPTLEPDFSPSHARRPACRPAAATARARPRRTSVAAAAAAAPRRPSGARSGGSASARRPRGAARCSCMCGSTACTAARRTRRADQHPLRPASARPGSRQHHASGAPQAAGRCECRVYGPACQRAGGLAQEAACSLGVEHLVGGRGVSWRAAGARIAEMHDLTPLRSSLCVEVWK